MGTVALAAEEASLALDHENVAVGHWWGTESAVQPQRQGRYWSRTDTLSQWSQR